MPYLYATVSNLCGHTYHSINKIYRDCAKKKEAKICRQEINPIAINADKWQNKLVPRIKYGAGSACLKQGDEVKKDDKSIIEKG
jgi:hypothetical protein